MRTSTKFVAVLVAGLAAACGSVSTEGDQPDAFVDHRPLLESVSPDHGPAGGGIEITITGSNLDSGEAHVVVGDMAATDVTVVSATEITATLPPGELESRVSVTVFNDGGTGNLLQAFTYNAAPVVAAIEPALGVASGNTAVTITGVGFGEGTPSVLIGGQAAANVEVVDDGTITAVTPTLAEGVAAWVPQDVVVENLNGVAVLPGGFRYKRPGLLIGQQGAYMTSASDPDRTMIYYLDPVAKQMVPMFNAWWGIKAMDVHPDGTLYALSNRQNLTGRRYLLTLDPIAGEATAIGPMVMAGTTTDCRVSDMAFNGTTLYSLRRAYVSGVGTRSFLVTINLETGECTDVSATQHTILTSSCGMALKDANTFYFLENQSEGYSLYQIGINNEEVGTPVPMTGDIYRRSAGMTLTNGTLYSLGRYDSGTVGNLIAVNPTDGSYEVVLDAVPFYAKGICRTPPSMN